MSNVNVSDENVEEVEEKVIVGKNYIEKRCNGAINFFRNEIKLNPDYVVDDVDLMAVDNVKAFLLRKLKVLLNRIDRLNDVAGVPTIGCDNSISYDYYAVSDLDPSTNNTRNIRYILHCYKLFRRVNENMHQAKLSFSR